MTAPMFRTSPADLADRVLGVAGGGLEDATWLATEQDKARGRIGQEGEVRLAAHLNEFASYAGGVTVMHDLMIPTKQYRANIDHLVVSGNEVFILDAKVWKPGRYWTLFGRSMRGHARFKPAEKKTMGMAQDRLTSWLAERGVDAVVRTPRLVVFSSSKRGEVQLAWLRVPGAQTMSFDAFCGWSRRHFKPRRMGRGARSADPQLVQVLSELLVAANGGRFAG